MCCSSSRAQRLVVEECLKWASQRIVFGKPLIEQGAIRAKYAVHHYPVWLNLMDFRKKAGSNDLPCRGAANMARYDPISNRMVCTRRISYGRRVH